MQSNIQFPAVMGQCSSRSSTDIRTNMSSQDYDELEKMLAGHWKFDRDENLEAFLEAAEIPEGMRATWTLNPDVIFTRDGNSLKEKTIISPGQEYDVIFILNEVKDWKEGDNFHIQVLPTFKDGQFVQEITPQLPNGGKRYFVNTSAKGNVLTGEMRVAGESQVMAKRFYKRC